MKWNLKRIIIFITRGILPRTLDRFNLNAGRLAAAGRNEKCGIGHRIGSSQTRTRQYALKEMDLGKTLGTIPQHIQQGGK